MSHQDTDRLIAPARQLQDLKDALHWIAGAAGLGDLAFRRDCTWTPLGLAFAAILWAWADNKTLTERFSQARKAVALMGILPRRPAATYQAFLKILGAWSPRLAAALAEALRARMRAGDAGPFEVAGFRAFGVDGSRLGLCRTRSNEGRFTAASVTRKRARNARAARRSRSRAARDRRAREKKADTPQMWLTLLFHIGTGLPWDWRLGASDSSERGHLREMLAGLPGGSLVVADAGFTGYEVWRAILESGGHLLIRVGSNVRLLRGLGLAHKQVAGGLVYLWPDHIAARGNPPLVLRLVVVHGGRTPVYLVTSVLDPGSLSDGQVAELYSRRWGVELFYRHFKQTYECAKLRSRTADHSELEAVWSLLGLWSMGLHARAVLGETGVSPQRVSVALVLSAYRKSLREYKSDPDPGESLRELLQKAIIDAYTRKNKSSREYPRKKREPPPGRPKIRHATVTEIEGAKSFWDECALGLTA